VVLVSGNNAVPNVFIAALPLLFKIRCNRQVSSVLPFAHTNLIVLQLKKKNPNIKLERLLVK